MKQRQRSHKDQAMSEDAGDLQLQGRDTTSRPPLSAFVPVFERLYPLRILVFPAAQARVVAVAFSSSWWL